MMYERNRHRIDNGRDNLSRLIDRREYRRERKESDGKGSLGISEGNINRTDIRRFIK